MHLPEAYEGTVSGKWAARGALALQSKSEDDEIAKLPDNVDFTCIKVFLVDDDLWNIFASRTVLEG
ncbi:MAG: hypothetical protein QM784_31065 [Polyangiaceae bacterium]